MNWSDLRLGGTVFHHHRAYQVMYAGLRLDKTATVTLGQHGHVNGTGISEHPPVLTVDIGELVSPPDLARLLAGAIA